MWRFLGGAFLKFQGQFCDDFLTLFGVIFYTFGVPGPRGPSQDPFWQHGRKRDEKNSIFNRFGVPSGTPRGALWRPFRSLWQPRGPKNQKNDALQGVYSRARFLIGFSSLFRCLVSLKTRIPCGRGIQNHIFDRNRKKHDFIPILWSFCVPFGTMLGPLAHLWGSRAPVFRVFPYRFFYQFFYGFWGPAGSPKKRHGGRGTWCLELW